jgi:CCR4-NOT transcriptional regulation complex NOT5 subunit
MPCYSLTLMCHLSTYVLHMTIATAPMTGADWYNNLSDQDRDLYDMIEDRCPEFTKLDADQCQEFMDELSEHGITTAEQFEDAYYYQTDSWHPEREFAQWIAEEVECLAFMNDAGPGSWLVIDWQASWDTALCYDFFTIEFDGETYFFNSNF